MKRWLRLVQRWNKYAHRNERIANSIDSVFARMREEAGHPGGTTKVIMLDRNLRRLQRLFWNHAPFKSAWPKPPVQFVD